MCGRFTLLEADKILSKEFGVSPLSPHYNIAQKCIAPLPM